MQMSCTLKTIFLIERMFDIVSVRSRVGRVPQIHGKAQQTWQRQRRLSTSAWRVTLACQASACPHPGVAPKQRAYIPCHAPPHTRVAFHFRFTCLCLQTCLWVAHLPREMHVFPLRHAQCEGWKRYLDMSACVSQTLHCSSVWRMT